MIEAMMSKVFEQSAFNPKNSFDLPGFFKNETTDSKIKSFAEADRPLNIENMNDFRDLTLEERQLVQKKTGWTDDQLNKCIISDTGVIHYKCDNEELKGIIHPCNVEYKQKQIEHNGLVIEVVGPEFNSRLDVQLPEPLYKESNLKQFKECNNQLKNAVSENETLRNSFSPRQLEAIELGKTPEGYTWHHDFTPGKMQLVERREHDRTIGGAAHTGGKSIWGGGY